MFKPFYISSFGGTATMWINKVLNTHHQVVSYHGTRSIPPYDSGTNDLSPDDFVEGMKVSMENSNNTKVFGAIHGFYGLSLSQAIIKHEGVFCAVIRSPIKRMNSLFNHHYKGTQKTGEEHWDKNISVYQDVINNNFDHVNTDNGNVTTSSTVNMFSWICNGTISNDIELLTGIGADLNFKMESLVQDRGYFKHFLEVITQGKIEVSDEYLDQIFTFNNVNKHAHVEQTEQQIFDSWPDIFKLVYKNAMLKHGGESVIKAYEDLDYPIIDNMKVDFALDNNQFIQVE